MSNLLNKIFMDLVMLHEYESELAVHLYAVSLNFKKAKVIL